VVLDPVVLANAGKLPDGPSAKLLTLLAYGQTLAYLNERANAEARQLRHWPPGTPGDLPSGSASVDRESYSKMFIRRQALARSIPAGGHSIDWCLTLSEPLIDRVVRRVGIIRDQDNVELDDDLLVRSLRIHAPVQLLEQWESVPDYTGVGCLDSNISIHTALCAGAPLVVSKLPAACKSDGQTIYRPMDQKREYPYPRRTGVVHLDTLIRAVSETFDFSAVDASVLERIAPTGPQRSDR
jgi:hypothetical protein